MKAFFKSCYPNLEEQLRLPSFEKSRVEAWQQLYDWNLPIDYSYFLMETAGKVSKGPSFDLAKVIPKYKLYQQRFFITVKLFLSWEELATWYGEQKRETSVLDLQYFPIAMLEDGGQLMIGLNKIAALAGGIFYESPRLGLVKLANNLLEFLQASTKQTPWTQGILTGIVSRSSIEQGQVQLSNFEAYPATKYHKEIVLLQQREGQLEYLITRSSIVLFGATTREYWLEELKNVQVDKVLYMKLAVNQIKQLTMVLDFGHTQEEITLYHIQEQRVIQKLLEFIINNSKR
ncbi:MAG: hypothetical protein ACRBFS_07355 [Aureispira sp.]